MLHWAAFSYDWARSDPRIVGLNPWHWSGTPGAGEFQPGLAEMPAVLDAVRICTLPLPLAYYDQRALLPCPALPCVALPCLALPCLALPCPALPCPALPCPALPWLALQCLAASLAPEWLLADLIAAPRLPDLLERSTKRLGRRL
jgi:hypothetical protein